MAGKKRGRTYSNNGRVSKRARRTGSFKPYTGGVGGGGGRRRRNLRVGGFLGMEKKFVDCAAAAVSVGTAWVIVPPSTGIIGCLSAPAQGDGEEQRDGRKVQLASIHLKGAWVSDAIESAPGPIPDTSARLCLVWDTQTNATAMVGTDVMDAGSIVDVHSFRNLSNSQRFVVLHDEIFTLRRQTNNEGGINLFASDALRCDWEINKTFKVPIDVNHNGTTANVSTVQDNSLSLIAVTTDSSIEIEYDCRVRFYG